MRTLSIDLMYGKTHTERVDKAKTTTQLAMPLRVLDGDGTIIAEDAAKLGRTVRIPVPDDEQLYVRLTWPSGRTETQRVPPSLKMTFSDGGISPREWLAWAVPRLNVETPLLPQAKEPGRAAWLDRIWMRLWHFDGQRWAATPIEPVQKYVHELAVQLDLKLEARPYCLQVGSDEVAWRLISLPGNGHCRVLLTPNPSTDPRGDPLKVLVTGGRDTAETMLEFLSRDNLGAASTVANSLGPLAQRLVHDKFKDPVAACAGGYFLLRIGQWETIPHSWWGNLESKCSWIADGAIIRCVAMLRSGLKTPEQKQLAPELLHRCLSRGVPIFAEGLQLMHEASALLRAEGKEVVSGDFEKVRALAAAQAWAGSSLSFYGASPDVPDVRKRYGLPGQGSSGLAKKAAAKRSTSVFPGGVPAGAPASSGDGSDALAGFGGGARKRAARRTAPKKKGAPRPSVASEDVPDLMFVGDVRRASGAPAARPRTAAKKAKVTKGPAKKAAAKKEAKAPAKKAAKTPAKKAAKAPARKAPRKKPAAKKSPAKKSAARKTAVKKAAKKTIARRPSPKRKAAKRGGRR